MKLMDHHAYNDLGQYSEQGQEPMLPTGQHQMETTHNRHYKFHQYKSQANTHCTHHTNHGRVIPSTSLSTSFHSNKRQREGDDTREPSYYNHLSPHTVPVLTQSTMEMPAQYENNYFYGRGVQHPYSALAVGKSPKKARLEQPAPVNYNPQEQYSFQNANAPDSERTLVELYGPPPPYHLVVQNLHYYKSYNLRADGSFIGGTSPHRAQPQAQVPAYQNHLETRQITDNTVYYRPERLSPGTRNSDSNYANGKVVEQQDLRSSSEHTLHGTPTKQQNIILINESKTDATVPPSCDTLNTAKQAPVKQNKKQFLPVNAVDMLKTWFYEHINYPYPTAEERAYLSEVTGLTHLQITNWFTNERKRKWTPKMKKEQEEMSEAGTTKKNWNHRNAKKKLKESNEDVSVAHECQTDATA